MPDVDWTATHEFVTKLGLSPSLPIAGSPEWVAADDAVKFIALVVAGDRWVLENEIRQRRESRRVHKEASLDVCEAKDWKDVARRLRQRDEFHRANPWAKRVVA